MLRVLKVFQKQKPKVQFADIDYKCSAWSHAKRNRPCAVTKPPSHFDDAMADLETLSSVSLDGLIGKAVIGKNYTRLIGSKGDISERIGYSQRASQ